MSTQSPVICSYQLGSGTPDNPLTDDDAIQKLKANQLVWVHLDATSENANKWLMDHVPNMDALTAEALLVKETRPRVSEYKDGTLIILRGVNLNDNANAEDMVSIRIWIDEHRIISTRIRRLKAVQDIKDRFENGKGPQNAAEFLVALTSRLFARMEPVVQELDDATDEIEDLILSNALPEYRHEVVKIRKKAIMLRRYIAPQKDAMAYLRTSDLPWLDQNNRRYLQEGFDRLTRYVEELDAIRERGQVIKEEISSIMADEMNQNTYALSIVAGIFLPLGFLTGLLGINVGGMPGVDSDFAFWLVCLLCFGFAGATLAIFKLLRWL